MSNNSVYIVRIWIDQNRVRFRIEDPHTADVFLFKSADALVDFLTQTPNRAVADRDSNSGECDEN